MKFGATFSRRSVPQWRAHDLDYDDIKNLIKAKTSSEEGCTRGFEANLLAILDSELERIDDVVRCKAGEIERRLQACQRTVKNSSPKSATDSGKITSLKQFLKVEAEIDRTSKDAQLLARFVNAQYTGFQKLIKKHAKWCRLSPNSPHSLSSQFLPRLETQHPFHRRVNFDHIMRQLSGLYNARLDSQQPSEINADRPLPDDLDLVPMQSSVTYWVHSDNQVETELFLLKHLTLQLPSSSGAIQQSTRTAYMDSKDWSVYTSVLSGSGREESKCPRITWDDNPRKKEVIVSIPENESYKHLPMFNKNLDTFLYSKEDLDFTSPEWSGVTSDDNDISRANWAKSASQVRQYIQSLNISPVIRISAERTGFVKVSHNTTTPVTSQVYATIDRNICSTRLRPGIDFLPVQDEELVNLEGHKNIFPHALLQIRWDGDSPRWLEELNGSHLIERVNGFSIYAHSMSILIPREVPKLPYWLPLLRKDIRKLQPMVGPMRRRNSVSPFVTTDSKTSSSQDNRPRESTTQPSSLADSHSPARKKSKRRNGYGTSSPVVYWSEFEVPPEEPYTIPIDETSSLLPWFRHRTQDSSEDNINGGITAAFRKFRGAVESEVKVAADGLTTLFYEKDPLSDEEDIVSEDSSSFYDRRRGDSDSGISRAQLLNRGYYLCVISCTILLSIFGLVGILLDGEAAGIGSVLVGFLIAMTLEIVSLVRFIMQGGHQGIAWIGFLVVGLAGVGFVPLVTLSGGV